MFGRPSQRQLQAIRHHVQGRHIHDLGAGDLKLSNELLRLGATGVTAIDRWYIEGVVAPPDLRITLQGAYFGELGDLAPDVAFVSWPINQDQPGLFKVMRAASPVIYLGKNTDGSMCGHPKMFQDMRGRELLAYIPELTNTLIVVGRPLAVPREPTGEERAGMAVYESDILSFEGVEALDAQTVPEEPRCQGQRCPAERYRTLVVTSPDGTSRTELAGRCLLPRGHAGEHRVEPYQLSVKP